MSCKNTGKVEIVEIVEIYKITSGTLGLRFWHQKLWDSTCWSFSRCELCVKKFSHNLPRNGVFFSGISYHFIQFKPFNRTWMWNCPWLFHDFSGGRSHHMSNSCCADSRLLLVVVWRVQWSNQPKARIPAAWTASFEATSSPSSYTVHPSTPSRVKQMKIQQL